jgi:hypothetical protein
VRPFFTLFSSSHNQVYPVLKNNKFRLQKAKHLQFRREYFLSRTNEVETYQIDVICEDYLIDYLKIIRTEIDHIKKIFLSKKKQVQSSINKIVSEVKGIKKKLTTYRGYIEF